MVEGRFVIPVVVGSSPISHPIHPTDFAGLFGLCRCGGVSHDWRAVPLAVPRR